MVSGTSYWSRVGGGGLIGVVLDIHVYVYNMGKVRGEREPPVVLYGVL